MKYLKENMLSLLAMTLVISVAMLGDANAQSVGYGNSVFNTAAGKLVELFKNAKMVVFVVGGFGLVALAFQAIFGKVKWAWFAALAFGLAVLAAASAVIRYAVNNDSAVVGQWNDTLGNNKGMN